MTQFLRFRDVEARTGLSRSTIYRRIAAKEFPAPVPLGNSTHIVGFDAQAIEDWCQQRLGTAAPESMSATV